MKPHCIIDGFAILAGQYIVIIFIAHGESSAANIAAIPDAAF